MTLIALASLTNKLSDYLRRGEPREILCHVSDSISPGIGMYLYS